MLKGYLISGQTTNYYWTNAWNNYLANPDVANTTIVKTRLVNMFRELMRLGQHQLS